MRTYARLSTRRLDLVLAYPWQHQEMLKYELPGGYTVTSLPRSRHLQSKFGSFDLRVRAPLPEGAHGHAERPRHVSPGDRQEERTSSPTAGTVIAEARLDVAQDRISAGDYPAFRKFLAEVDAVMAERIVVSPAPEARVHGAPSSAIPLPFPVPTSHRDGSSASSSDHPGPGGPHQPMVERAPGAGTP